MFTVNEGPKQTMLPADSWNSKHDSFSSQAIQMIGSFIPLTVLKPE